MLVKIPLSEYQNKNYLPNNKPVLRWGGCGFDEQTQTILAEIVYSPIDLPELETIKEYGLAKNLGLMLIPTGLGCSIGGFGGDANLCANLIADEFDYLIINPNVSNGGAWQNLQNNMLYVEGAGIDLFTQNLIALRPVKKNKIGLLIDKGIPDKLIQRELEIIKAAETIWGLDFSGYEITQEEIKPQIELLPNDFSSGSIQNVQTLLNSAQKLINHQAEAIALITNCQTATEQAEKNYLQGTGPDPIGGIEAICSHLITRRFLLPCAHAPCFEPETQIMPNIDKRVSPEIASFSFLPSVLKGLMQAPKLIKAHQMQNTDLTCNSLEALIAPADCWFGSSFLQAHKFKSYAVGSNITGMGLKPNLLNLPALEVKNYLELIGHLRAYKKGLKITNY